MDVISQVCRNKRLDIVFAFDSSSNVQYRDFLRQLDFAKTMIENLDITSGRTRVGAILFSEQINKIFDLDEFSRAEDMKASLNKISMSYGGSRIDEALRYIRTKSFRRRVIRPRAAKVAIVITGSPSSRYLFKSKRQASKTRAAGITVIPIGIGDVNPHEIRVIAGPLNRKSPILLPTFRYLQGMLEIIAREACGVAEPEPTAILSDHSCGNRQEADIMFVLDSVNAGKRNTKKTLTFMKKFVRNLEVDPDKIQVGVMSSECQDILSGFHLGAKKDTQTLENALSNLQPTDFSEVLKQMRRGAFSNRRGGRNDAKKIAILIVDGELEQPIRSLTQAQRAKLHGIEVFVVQVGEVRPSTEMLMMSDAPTRQHFFRVRNYDGLDTIRTGLWDALCDEL